MGYSNPLHGLDSDGNTMSDRGVTIPAVTADHTEDDVWTGHRHLDGEPDRGYTQDDLDTQAEDPDTPFPVGPGSIIVLDIGAANQRELERRVAAGEPLPEGITVDQVRAWHGEYAGPVVTGLTIGNADQMEQMAGVLSRLEDAAEVAERCPAACGLPADSDPESRSRVACRVHPDGAHRCFRRPRHQYRQDNETGGKLSAADHQCDCDFVWLNLSGGLAAHMAGLDSAQRAATEAAARKAEDGRRRILAGFARWADTEIPSGHAAGQVVADLPDAIVVDFGSEFAWFRPEHFADVQVGDFVTVGPAVSRWRITPRGTAR